MSALIILWSQVQVLVGPPVMQTLISNGGGFCLLRITLSVDFTYSHAGSNQLRLELSNLLQRKVRELQPLLQIELLHYR